MQDGREGAELSESPPISDSYAKRQSFQIRVSIGSSAVFIQEENKNDALLACFVRELDGVFRI